MIISNKFPNVIELQRVKTLRNYEKLHDNEQQAVLFLHEIIKKQYKDKKQIVYLQHAIPNRISEFYGDFVQGDTEGMAINLIAGDEKEAPKDEEETVNKIIEENGLLEDAINDYAYDQSEYGFEVLLGYVDDGNFKIQIVPKDQYFPQIDGSVIFATYIFDPKDADKLVTKRDTLLYTQEYKMENNDVVIAREVWKTDISGVATDKQTLEYANIDAEKTERIEGLGQLPIVQIDNGRKTRFGFGASDYASIMPQLQELNDRRTHISTQLLKNLDAKIQLPELEDLKNDDGTLKPFDYIMKGKEDSDASYITNENPLIEMTETHIANNLKFISWITAIPMYELLKSAMPEKVEAMRIQLFGAIRKTTRKRSRVTKGVKEIIKIGYKMLKSKDLTSKIEIKYSEVLPVSELLQVEIETGKVDGGLSSRRSSMKRLENFSDEEVDAEMGEIKKEETQDGIIDPHE